LRDGNLLGDINSFHSNSTDNDEMNDKSNQQPKYSSTSQSNRKEKEDDTLLIKPKKGKLKISNISSKDMNDVNISRD